MLDAVKFHTLHGPVRSEAVLLELATAQDLAHVRHDHAPACFVVPVARLADLHGISEVILCGRKNPAKQLGRHLLRRTKVPLLDGGYTTRGRLVQGIESLLCDAREIGEQNIYFLGARDDIVGELLAAARANALPALPPGANELERALRMIPPGLAPHGLRQKFIGASAETELLLRLAGVAARCDVPVLLLGESGTGKELIAQEIHQHFVQFFHRRGPLKAVNCASLSEHLLESELFGHVKGAFTGALQDHTGLWQEAADGTLFLDEIGELTLAHQAKILRALAEGKIRRVGSTISIDVNARIIAATNRDLFGMVLAGQFREDLYYRLRNLCLRTPALRDRREDIPALAQHLWRLVTQRPGAALGGEITGELQRLSWPGNVRELRSVLSSMHVLFPGEKAHKLEHLHLAMRLAGKSLTETVPAPAVASLPAASPAAQHCVDCFRQLRLADEEVRAVKVYARPLLRGTPAEARRGRRSACATLRQHLAQLELLCLHPVRFGSRETFEKIARFKGHLSGFIERLEKDLDEGRRFWTDKAKQSHETASAAIFAELESLMTRCGTGMFTKA